MFPVSIDFIYSLHDKVTDKLNKNHSKKKDLYDEHYDYTASTLVSLKGKLREIIDDYSVIEHLGHDGPQVIIYKDLVNLIKQAKV